MNEQTRHGDSTGRRANVDAAIFGDKEETVYSAELYLLRKVANASSDMVKARHWQEFREACGGQEKLDAAHEAATHEYESWLDEGDG